MFCLRSWLPLLFIPTLASPSFIFLFFLCTYLLNRPCIYCSLLLAILFASSCQWSERCFFNFDAGWFDEAVHRGPGASSSTATSNLSSTATYAAEMMRTTVTAVAGALVEEAKRRVLGEAASATTAHDREWTGLGLEWLRSLLGRREWRVPCVDVVIRL